MFWNWTVVLAAQHHTCSMQHGLIVLCVSHTLKEVSTFTQITAVCELTNSLMLWKGNWVAEIE